MKTAATATLKRVSWFSLNRPSAWRGKRRRFKFNPFAICSLPVIGLAVIATLAMQTGSILTLKIIAVLLIMLLLGQLYEDKYLKWKAKPKST